LIKKYKYKLEEENKKMGVNGFDGDNEIVVACQASLSACKNGRNLK